MDIVLDWRDIIEIPFFISIILGGIEFLKKDSGTRLLSYFYLYCLLFFVSYFTGCTGMSTALILLFPVAATAALIFHQQTLQKQLVPIKNLSPKRVDTFTDWQETLLKFALYQLNHQTTLYCVIERTDSLYHFLETPFYLDAPLQEYLLKTFAASTEFNEQNMLWLNDTGKLLGINCLWKHHEAQSFVIPDQQHAAWKEYAALYTTKTDAIILKTNPISRTFSLMAQGTCIEDITSSQALTLLEKYTKKVLNEKKELYASLTPHLTQKQPHT